jgi:predicted ATPase/DNA-binding SARP family transcriptional activator/tetratricopeptide (TPR) repeat protein
MLADLCALFFGGFVVRSGGETITTFGYEKVKALFAYLMIEDPVPLSRDHLAGLLWPDLPEHKARHSLRQAISQLRTAIQDDDRQPPLILTGRTTIQRNHQSNFNCDVFQFEQFLKPTDEKAGFENDCLEKALDLYRGELLKGLSLAGAEYFSEWLNNNRDRYHRMAVHAVEKVIAYHDHHANVEQVRTFAEKWLAMEPWREEAYRKLMLSLARSGQRSAALRQYEICRQVLFERFGLLPDHDTEKLAARIQAITKPGVPLPVQSAPFIGRTNELLRLMKYLSSPATRLITIIGPVGIGKTSLAVQVGGIAAAKEAPSFLNGVLFLSLSSLYSMDSVLAALAQALSYTFRPGTDRLAQLLHILQDRELLLILDNTEHLPSKEITHLVSSILKDTQDIKILVTSRHRLNLSSELLFHLGGLSIPSPEDVSQKDPIATIHSFTAPQLFLSVIERTQPGYRITYKDALAINRICQLVEGMPLGVELAAAWSDTISLPEIADRAEQSFDHLQVNWEDHPPRHRSMRAAIDTSWILLDEVERSAFARLSVFRSGFSSEAGQSVAGVSHQVLSRLVNKSFLKHDVKTGRFSIHELLLQYGLEKLAHYPNEEIQVRDLHCEYFIQFMLNRIPLLFTQNEKTIVQEIQTNLGNITSAWAWSIQRKRIDNLAAIAPGLHRFYVFKGLFQEGINHFQTALEAWPHQVHENDPMNQAWLLAYQGDLIANSGNWEAGRNTLTKALQLMERSQPDKEQMHLLNAFVLSKLGTFTQQVDEARQYLQESLTLYRDIQDQYHIAHVLVHLANLQRIRGELVDARLALEESLQIQQNLELLSEKARTMSVFGLLALRLGKLSQSEMILEEAVTLARTTEDRDILAISLEAQGLERGYRGDFQAANELLKDSMDLRSWMGQKMQVSIIQSYISITNLHLGHFREALANAHYALALAEELSDLPSKATAKWAFGLAALAEKDYEAARINLDDSIASFRTGWQQDWQARRGIAHAAMGCLECSLGNLTAARNHLNQAMQLILENRSYIGLLHALPAVGLYYQKKGRQMLAEKFYNLAKTQPFVQNSCWFSTVTGQF